MPHEGKLPVLTRREFLKGFLQTALGAVAASWLMGANKNKLEAGSAQIPTRILGQTGRRVSLVGFGGEGILRSWGQDRKAIPLIQRALDLGITYFDTAPAYSASQDYYGEILGERRSQIFLASKTHDRSRQGSLRLLDDSLKRLKTDHLDLWQLHDLRTHEDLDAIFSPEGAIHALEQARREGRVRFLGITGHTHPQILVEAIQRYPFDTILVALNAADRSRLSFIDQVLPVANSQRLGIIGMKVVAKGYLLRPDGVATMQEALGYVLSLPISTAIVGFNTVEELEEVVRLAQAFQPFSQQQQARLERLALPYAEEVNGFKQPA